MDIKVWIDGVPRDVGNVTEHTSCEDLIFALSNAASKPGLYVLVAPWRGNEITLSPNEKPLVVINRLGEDPKTFEFVLRRLPTHINPGPQLVPPHAYQTRGYSQGHLPMVPMHQSGSMPGYPPEPNEKLELRNKMALQEQEIERNRLHLLNLDKEITRFEQTQDHSSISMDCVGPAAELRQLSLIPWNDLLESNKAKHASLIKEKSQLEAALQTLSSRISETHSQVLKQEKRLDKMSEELLDDLELLNNKREEIASSFRRERSKSQPSEVKVNGNSPSFSAATSFPQVSKERTLLNNPVIPSRNTSSAEGVMI
ncbi:hypothetical protein Ciccas_004409 [Cichlidogyrus casuarinus]|uniref:Ras-associating domain-containing protein n=1 Tax=Cichlidogyrus casuarinus TaxID=1844966 RepID=A0ABD2QBK9_9PLAT